MAPVTSPVRFGLLLSAEGSAARVPDVARRAEDGGYSTLLVPDHFDDQPAPLLALAAAAATTSTLRLGTLVLNQLVRPAALLGKELATLDELSGGRLEVGLGAGWHEPDAVAVGGRLDGPGERIASLGRLIERLIALWAGDAAGPGGPVIRPRPVQRPHPPLVLPLTGPRMTRLAARVASTVEIMGRTISEDEVRTRVQRLAAAAGDRFASIELAKTVAVCGRSMEDAEPRDVAARVASAGGPALPSVLVGDMGEVCDEIARRREALGISYWIVPEAAMALFTPVIAAVRSS